MPPPPPPLPPPPPAATPSSPAPWPPTAPPPWKSVIGALGESFQNANSGVTFTYNPTGSGSGIQAVSEGRCDIGLASRGLKDDEKSSGLTETVLAYDGIAVVVSPENPVSDLTIEQIADIYTGKITNWSEVGGNDAEIVLIGREAGSGTRDGFESITGTEEACQYRQELTSTGDVIATVSQNPNAIGYASLSAVKESVKALSVGGVAPSEDTVKDGSYAHPAPLRPGDQGRRHPQPPPPRPSLTTPPPPRPLPSSPRPAPWPPTAKEEILPSGGRFVPR